MWTTIGSDSTVPIYEQIIAQVVGVIASGGLKPGDMLPSVRELAGKLLVNPNTVARAYGELERAGLVEPRRGTGMLILPASDAKAADMRLTILRDRLRPMLRDALGFGLDACEILEIIRAELDSLSTRTSAPAAS